MHVLKEPSRFSSPVRPLAVGYRTSERGSLAHLRQCRSLTQLALLSTRARE